MYARTTIRTLAFAASTFLGAASLAPAAVLDSALFNHKYEGNLAPLPNYAENGAFNAGPSTDGNIMTYRVSQGGAYWNSTDWSVNSATGYSFEMRLKIDDDFAEGTKGAVAVYMGDGSAGDIMSIGKNFVMTANGAFTSDTNNNTSDYHNFRITLIQDGTGPGSPTLNFYRDNQLIQTFPSGGNWASNVLFIGSGGSSFGGPTVHVDYIRWDSTGAYEPVPEPASLALIGLAGLLAIRRRH